MVAATTTSTAPPTSPLQPSTLATAYRLICTNSPSPRRGRRLMGPAEPIHWNLSSVKGPSDGLLNDCVVQEIDVKTGLVMFEWHALGHVALADSYAPVPYLSSTVYDFFHLNSIQPQADGDLLLDARNTWTAYMINASTGATLW